MYSEKINQLISAALADGMLTEKEKQVLLKNAQAEGIDLDEFEMVLSAKLIELNKPNATATQKSNKFGDLRKCPACGAIVNSFDGICKECGYAFENLQANQASTKLFELLQKATSEKEREAIVATFPLPLTKADILEFITTLHSHVYDPIKGFINTHSGYHMKYAECMQKCMIAFKNDPQLSFYIDEFNRQNQKEAKLIKVIIICAIIITVVFSILYSMGYLDAFLETQQTQVLDDIKQIFK